ncbi:Fibrinogen- domains (FReDs) [Branchiostoma belcheri]|nr:Fibrinogen- domains (FReDs) [Branchiostoma belcheri]
MVSTGGEEYVKILKKDWEAVWDRSRLLLLESRVKQVVVWRSGSVLDSEPEAPVTGEVSTSHSENAEIIKSLEFTQESVEELTDRDVVWKNKDEAKRAKAKGKRDSIVGSKLVIEGNSYMHWQIPQKWPHDDPEDDKGVTEDSDRRLTRQAVANLDPPRQSRSQPTDGETGGGRKLRSRSKQDEPDLGPGMSCRFSSGDSRTQAMVPGNLKADPRVEKDSIHWPEKRVSKMSSKKLFPNDKTAPEVSVGHYGNRWTNGIVLTLSGLAAVGFVALLFMVREIASMREQQTAFMRETRDQQTVFMRETRDQQTVFMRETRDQQTAFMRETRDQQTVFQKDLQGLKDQVLLMKQQNEAKDTGPSSSTEDWQRDDSATFWKSAEVHHRSKRNSEAKTVLILGNVPSCAYEDPGFGRCTYISINGQVSQIENEILRGHLVFILNEQTGEVLDKAVFDTWGGYGGGGRAAAQRLTTYLQGVKERSTTCLLMPPPSVSRPNADVVPPEAERIIAIAVISKQIIRWQGSIHWPEECPLATEDLPALAQGGALPFKNGVAAPPCAPINSN